MPRPNLIHKLLNTFTCNYINNDYLLFKLEDLIARAFQNVRYIAIVDVHYSDSVVWWVTMKCAFVSGDVR